MEGTFVKNGHFLSEKKRKREILLHNYVLRSGYSFGAKTRSALHGKATDFFKDSIYSSYRSYQRNDKSSPLNN